MVNTNYGRDWKIGKVRETTLKDLLDKLIDTEKEIVNLKERLDEVIEDLGKANDVSELILGEEVEEV